MLKQIGKYTISERIGRGTYSRVYRAVDPQGRPVAIKVSTTRTEPDHLAEFQKDLVAAASVLHPSLAAVHDLGFEDDFPYLVMELVEGRDLDKILKSNHAPSMAERIRVMQQIGEALRSAHERGVFHLDIRPSKIVLSEDGTAKLLDLGLGRLSFDPARVTENGYLIGAPFYMSPERLTAIDTANAQCDIWSFGVTFYEWISGHHPFYDDDGERMIGNIMDGAPLSLADVPAPLNQAILRAIEKDPADRYRTMFDFLADLKPLVGDLKRGESDALMAEALKQTDSGRWHEARRIARQMRDLEPQQGPSSQMFGFSEPELEKDKVAERARPVADPAPPIPPPEPTPAKVAAATTASAAVAAAAATVATVVDTPEPAPPVQRRPITPPLAPAESPIIPPPRPQRPERTAPKIPSISPRNGSTIPAENGAPTSPRVRPPSPAPPTNGARVAPTPAAEIAEAPPKPTAPLREAVPETEVPARSETTRPRSTPPEYTRPISNPRPTPPPQQHVRILEAPEPSGFPWVKILGFLVPALLMAGALFFFLGPNANILKIGAAAGDDSKQISRPSRVIQADKTDNSDTSAFSPAPANSQPANGAPSIPGSNGPTAGTPNTPTDSAITITDPETPATPEAPRTFDPRTLPTPSVPVRRRTASDGSLATLAAPSLGSNGDVLETATLPVAVNAPPPPTAQKALEPPRRLGGSFSQPVLIHMVPPIYPPAAMQRKAQGAVRFQATITKDGSVTNLQLLSGDPLLNLAAKQAVLQWKYTPAKLNGQPTEVTQAIVVNFTLNQ
jgi:serine/threonine-protein kinase